MSKKSTTTVKVGFVNIRKLITSAPQVELIRQSLVEKFKSENKKIIALRHEISKINTAYENEASEKSLSKLQTMISSKQLELAKAQQNLKDAYSLRRNEELGKLQTLIVETVAAVSKEKGLDIVLNNTGVVYVGARVDITKEVSQLLTEKLEGAN